jgi:aspartyl/asparaginyl beta-hydroxylase (cupin superfamily)
MMRDHRRPVRGANEFHLGLLVCAALAAALPRPTWLRRDGVAVMETPSAPPANAFTDLKGAQK